MTHEKQFSFQTPIFIAYYKKHLGIIYITGVGYYDDSMHSDEGRGDDDPESLFSFKVQSVSWNQNMIGGGGQDILDAYKAKYMLSDDVMSAIDKATLQHMEWLFAKEPTQHTEKQ